MSIAPSTTTNQEVLTDETDRLAITASSTTAPGC